jgi:glucose/mannose transport system substrate-binding protein
VSRLGVSPGDVDDVAQEAFLVASAKIADVPMDREKAFLFGVVAYVAQNARRAKARRHRAYEQFVDVDAAPPPSQEDLMDELRTRGLVEAVLRDMSPELRGVLVLCEVEGLAVPEIAHRLDLPTGTAASRLRRARKAFFERFSRASVPRRGRDGGRAEVGSRDVGPEILSWWVNDGEVEALRALVDIYRRGHPGAPVNCSGIRDTRLAKDNLRARMASGSPPDTFQANGGQDLFHWTSEESSATPSGHLEPLEFLFESERWRAAFPQEVLDLVTWHGEAYAVPLNIHRTNTLLYDRNVLAHAELTPPRSLDDLHRVAEVLRKKGIQPLALGTREPWVLSLIAFEQILVAIAGPRFYREFCEGKQSPTAPELRVALEELGRLLDIANPDASTLSWASAADRVRIGSAAMTLMGDWTKGYLERRGFLEGESFGVAPSPGTQGAFVFTMDAFGLPHAAPHRDGAIELLKVFGSEQGQSVFNRLKGSRPARQDVATTLRRDSAPAGVDADADARDLADSVHVPTMTCLVAPAFSLAVDAAMGAFAESRDVGSALRAIEASYGRVQG